MENKIIKFLDRSSEMKRLDELMAVGEGGMAIIYGRRRVGKTRLLLEWAHKYHGLYSVADQSASGLDSIIELVEHWTAWSGIPRYWELAVAVCKSVELQIDELILDPMGPLHSEPDRLLLDEIPLQDSGRRMDPSGISWLIL